ncbi:hypothetical protein Purlil1_2520 [Purpureocillium lilacinum]|uniref:Uncharacterized protein n=1 Tax=Purpureocillium lilacinum TaxID=33203 RepID=A0ABR0CCD5_PURLI|nr:hypothetical protein Purlil1_2520 [Purpureocillium lilacinum]
MPLGGVAGESALLLFWWRVNWKCVQAAVSASMGWGRALRNAPRSPSPLPEVLSPVCVSRVPCPLEDAQDAIGGRAQLRRFLAWEATTDSGGRHHVAVLPVFPAPPSPLGALRMRLLIADAGVVKLLPPLRRHECTLANVGPPSWTPPPPSRVSCSSPQTAPANGKRPPAPLPASLKQKTSSTPGGTNCTEDLALDATRGCVGALPPSPQPLVVSDLAGFALPPAVPSRESHRPSRAKDRIYTSWGYGNGGASKDDTK